MTSPDIVSFEQKESRTKETIKNILIRAKNPCICFSGGKKSIVLLHLIKSVTKIPIPVIFIDTTVHFENTCSFIEKIQKLWRFKLLMGTPHVQSDNIAQHIDICCNSLIIAPLYEIIQKNKFDYVFIGSVLAEDRIKQLFDIHPDNKSCISVSPTEQFRSKEIWQYIHVYNLPYCSLYDNGYMKIDCKPCSFVDKNRQKSKHIPEDEELIQNKLKKLGYL